MKYTYFPGCSLKGIGKAYEESLLAVFKALGVEMQELEDWNCCGASAYMSVNETKAFMLAARNLTLAEQHKSEMIAPCSACYLVHQKTKNYIEEYPETGEMVRKALEKGGLQYKGGVGVRHSLDVVVNDIGLDTIAKKVKNPLKGLKVFPYYGCQIVRPYATFDDQTRPVQMDNLLRVLGAEVLDHPLKTRCCGGSLTGTIPEVGERLVYILLREAWRRGADVIAVLCPLCQFNLDAYQDQIERTYEDVSVPVVYFTQLMGIAFGLSQKELGLHRCIKPAGPVLFQKIGV